MSNIKKFPSRAAAKGAVTARGATGMKASEIDYIGFIMTDDRTYSLENPRDIVHIVAFMSQRGIKVRRED